MKLLFCDAETAYSTEYSLSKMSTQAHIHDARFKVHGWGLASLTGAPMWVKGKQAEAILKATVPKSICVMHNACFDAAILAWRYGLRPGRIIDTLSLSRAMIGVALRSHSLDNVAKLLLGRGKVFGLDQSKGKWDLTPQEEAILADYCAFNISSDINLTRDIFKRLIRFFPQSELDLIDWTARAYIEPALLLDKPMLVEYHAEVVEAKEAALRSVGLESRELLMSNPKFAEALEALGVTPPTKISPATGKESFAFAKTDQGLKDLLEHDDARVQALVAARLEVKSTIEETRSKLFLEAAEYGPVPVQYNYSGAMQTHRFSGAGKMNFQNLRRGGRLRDAITAPEGHAIVVSDLSQIELRITLGLAGEVEALERLKRGEDLYSWFARLMYNLSDATPVEKWQRQVAKSAVLGLGFGMGAKKFQIYCQQQGIKITLEDAERAVKLYRTTFSGVPRLWRIADRALPLAAAGEAHSWPAMKPLFTTGHEPLLGAPGMRLPNGLWIKYPGLRREAAAQGENDAHYSATGFAHVSEGRSEWRYDHSGGVQKIFGSEVIANVVQGTACIVAKEKLVEVNKILPVKLFSHDELGALVRLEKAEIGSRIVAAIMRKSPTWWPELPVGCETGVAVRYGEAKH